MKRERISRLRLGFLARRETARKRSIHAVCMQVRRAGTLRFCQEPAHDAPTDKKIDAESRNAGNAARGTQIIFEIGSRYNRQELTA